MKIVLISTTFLTFSLFRRNGPSAVAGKIFENNEHHNLQEYTYKKITPCDVCSQVLRGKKSFTFISVFFSRFVYIYFYFLASVSLSVLFLNNIVEYLFYV